MVAAALPSAAAVRGLAEHLMPASVQFRRMGVLDDAIREHLDLRRKHGAPEEELEQQEEEALGPARRELAQEPEEEGGEPEEVADEAVADEAVADEPVVEEAAADPEVAESAVVDENAPEAPTEFVDHASLALEDEPEEESLGEPAPSEEPGTQAALAEEPKDVAAPEPRDEQVDSWFEEDEPAADQPAAEDQESADGDVLEDTPDFLQETPEHDRLWFEQKPPRDFDFD